MPFQIKRVVRDTGNFAYQNYQLTQLPTLFYINAAGEILAESYSFDGIKSTIH